MAIQNRSFAKRMGLILFSSLLYKTPQFMTTRRSNPVRVFGSNMTARAATHSGSWYTSNAAHLSAELSQWLSDARDDGVDVDSTKSLRALICPHAGYSYSGRAAAYSYAAIASENYRRCIILGPSHHVYLPDECVLSPASTFAFPGGSLEADTDAVQKLYQTGRFKYMTNREDEDEHSLEMQIPYIGEVFKNRTKENPIKLVCIMVGSLSQESERTYGAILADLFENPENLFLISSDFCHWGQRFRFNTYNPVDGAIWESISALDHRGMRLIEAKDTKGFAAYLMKEKNTICGRHPIGLLLQMVNHHEQDLRIKFVRYEQSSKCQTQADSSVSYASAHVRTAL